MSEALRDFEHALLGGHDAGEIHIARDEDGLGAQMWLMDGEYDPVRISFDPEGAAKLHAEENKWLLFTADQLRFIADAVEIGAQMTRDCYDENGEEQTGGLQA